MSLGRWTATTVAMAATAWALAALGPDPALARQAVTGPQALVDSAGPDALLVTAAAVAGWLCWAWGALGLLFTALSALPGAAGCTADLLLGALLPAGARRLAAVALGLTLSTGAPALAWAAAGPPSVGALATAAADRPVSAVDGFTGAAGVLGSAGGPPGIPPDWPDSPGDAPAGAAPTTADRVVVRGDCLWDIATDWLAAQRPGTTVSDADTLAAVSAWWQSNATVIGADPDLLLPGQVLAAPPPGAAPPGTPPTPSPPP